MCVISCKELWILIVGRGLAPAVLLNGNFLGGGTKAPPYDV